VAPHRWRDDGGFDDLLALATADDAITGAGLRPPALRVVQDGQVLDARRYTRRARTGAHTIDDLVDPGRVLDLFAGGATVVLQSLHRWSTPVARFCRDLELEVGHPMQANAYLTPPGATGLAPHHDTHDVFVLQVHGTKHWTVREPVIEAPLARHRSDHAVAGEQAVLFEAELQPGDVLYLPRGFVHAASAQEGMSLHLTIGVLATTVHDLLVRIVDGAAEVPAFRRSLPPGHTSDEVVAREVVEQAVAGLSAWLAELDPAPVAHDLRRRFLGQRRPLLQGQLGQLERLDAVDDRSEVRRRTGCPAITETAGDRLLVRLGDRTVDLPAVLEPAVHRLLDGARRPVAELCDLLDAGSRLVLVRRLIREGALEAVDGG
jgi:bifunctional lysine-specific demethylase and histidyl-hydroxylase NO66